MHSSSTSLRSLHRSLALTVTLALIASGCATRSISNPGYSYGGGNSTYAGELSDFDVVGTHPYGEHPAADIFLHPHQRVLLVQSGAGFPDERMITGLAEHFEVGVASGVPTPALATNGMRAAAHLGGFDAVIVYWGILESTEDANVGAAASWVPIVGAFVPDTDQRVRARLRIVVMDVRTSRWRTLLPAPIENVRSSSMVTRGSSDRHQVEELLGAAIPVALAAIEKDVLRP